ncbi:TfuA domain-containing protein [Streptomyces sp. NPDC046984]|uniref:TfuA domain-containing protein n=1 Tax=unclassified Streptomyces TaxID=2593676 RepID=UPI0033C32D82
MIHVFVGPSLPRSEPVLTTPGLQVRAPIGHGDLFDTTIRAGDTALIIDGVYHQAPTLRHKEILAAMGRGVRVIGAASIGALRAAELAPFGMLGVGSIYTAYARGEIDSDDEVAVGQAPDGDWDALTWPMVNLRHVLKLAALAGRVDGERAASLLADLRTVYYPQRTTAAVRAICRRHSELAFADWLAVQRERDPYFGDLKRTDALEAVHTTLAAPAPQPGTGPSPRVWETIHYQRWANTAAHARVDGLDLRTEDRLVYQQVFDPGFPHRWTAYLEYRSQHPANGPARLLAERCADAAGSVLPAHRLFHPLPDLRDPVTVALLLAGEILEDRRAVARYADTLTLAVRTRPGFTAAAVREDLARRLLLQVWRCKVEDLDAAASARGLVCAARAVEAAKRLVPGFLAETQQAGGHPCLTNP